MNFLREHHHSDWNQQICKNLVPTSTKLEVAPPTTLALTGMAQKSTKEK